jgi:hypothetical protein
MIELPQGELGYRIEDENHKELEKGYDHQDLLRAFKEVKPDFNEQINPTDIVKVVHQGKVGSCQGQSLATVFQICFYLATGRFNFFSAAAGYYLSQKNDRERGLRIRGDHGSTLSGGRWVATEHGMCLDSDWPYVAKYNPEQPEGIEFPFKLSVSKPFKKADDVIEWIKSGLPVQTGVRWGKEMNREEVTSASRSGGGHSTCLWTMKGEDINNINSWGESWNGDGVHVWTQDALAEMIDRGGTFVGYSPEGFDFPDLEPIKF